MDFKEILDRIDKMIEDYDSATAPKLEGLVSDDNKIPEILRGKRFAIDFTDNTVRLYYDGKVIKSKCHPDDKFNAVVGINNVLAKWLIDVSKEAMQNRRKREEEAKNFKVGDIVIGHSVDTATGAMVKGKVVYVTDADVAVITTLNAIRVLNRVTCRKVSA